MNYESQNNCAAVCVEDVHTAAVTSGELTDAQLDQVAGGVIGVDDAIVIGGAVVMVGLAITATVAVTAWFVTLWW